MGDAFAELEEVESISKGTKPGPEKPAKPPVKTEPPEKKPEPTAAAPDKQETTESGGGAAPEGKDSGKPPEKPIESETEPDPTAKFHLSPDLRKELRRVYKVVSEKEAELSKLKSAKPPQHDEERTALVTENRTLKERLQTVEKELKYADYTRSPEFKEKFEAPFQRALQDAYEETKELWVNTPDGGERQATSADFDKILEAAPQEVRKLAKEMFGDNAEDALTMRRKLIDLRRNADREAKRYREEAEKINQTRITEETQQREAAERTWRAAHEELTERFPEEFGQIEGDDELNEALAKGTALVDKAFNKSLPLEERIKRQAANRMRAAAYSRVKVLNKRLTERIKELEGWLADYEKSQPGEGKGGRTINGAGDDDGFRPANEELDAIEAGTHA